MSCALPAMDPALHKQRDQSGCVGPSGGLPLDLFKEGLLHFLCYLCPRSVADPSWNFLKPTWVSSAPGPSLLQAVLHLMKSTSVPGVAL